MNTREQFWSAYYSGVVQTRDSRLDYSNERVQMQTFGLALEAAGPLRDRRCIDIGCGWGDMCRAMLEFRAARVTGVDIVPELIEEHRRTDPQISWLCGSLEGTDVDGALGQYDVAFLLEVLQYMPLENTLRCVWERLLPGGRMVAVFPNASCPIVSRTRRRFDAHYAPPPLPEVIAAVWRLPDVDHLRWRALWFSADQRVVPYDVSPWRTSGSWSEEPNRIQFVALKRGAQGG